MATSREVDRYYESWPAEREAGGPERYPHNHVRFSPWLQPLGWCATVGRLLGAEPFRMRTALLREYDRAAPHAGPLGTEAELAKLRELLELHCRRIDDNPYMSTVGRYLLRTWTLRMLQARTSVLRHYDGEREHIEAHGRVSAPIIITGTPRSGTTLLHRLLSEDPATRSPYTFELETPLPPLMEGADPLADSRIEKSGHGLALMTRLAPGFLEKFAESHLLSPVEMEECFIYMLSHNGAFIMNGPQAGEEYVSRFLALDDKRPVLRYERLFLTLLDAYRPARSHWTLKAPNYAPYFPLVFDEYPDARVVLTHRNPLVTLPSVCRLLESWCIAFDRDGTFDKHRFATFAEPYIRACLEVPLAHRKAHPEQDGQIFDCMYDELIADPLGMVKRVYAKFDLELTPEAEQRMRAYLQNNRQGKHGRHRYSLDEYGFLPEDVHARYREYMERFGFDNPLRDEGRRAIAS